MKSTHSPRIHCRPAGCVLSLGLLLGAAHAQVEDSKPSDLVGIPSSFLPKGGNVGFGNHGTPAGYKPNPDPRDFTASYVGGGGGPPPPGAGVPPPGGGAPGGPGGPGGGAPGSGGLVNGVPRTGNSCLPDFDIFGSPIHVISSATELVLVGEMNHEVRRIYIGGKHAPNFKPSYMGESIGHWEGNTLVADTIGIRQQPGVDLQERFTKQADGSIAVVSVELDPEGKPIETASNSTMVWRPDLSFLEEICEDFGEAFGPDYGK